MDTFLAILCFFIGLLFLISLHELGHFIAAKIFGVYCFEYSICFGPKVVRRKPKFAETYFCIGVIPLGGYVSMFGEDADDSEKNKKQNAKKINKSSINNDDESINAEAENKKVENEELFTLIEKKNYRLFKKQQRYLKKQEKILYTQLNSTENAKIQALEVTKAHFGVEELIKEEDFYSNVKLEDIPNNRKLDHINRGKRFVIMGAGIATNFLLGFILYLIAFSCFPYVSISTRMTAMPTHKEDGTPVEHYNSQFIDQINVLNSTCDKEHTYIMDFVDLTDKIYIIEDNLFMNEFEYAVENKETKEKYFNEKLISLPNAYGVLHDTGVEKNVAIFLKNQFNLSDLSLGNQLYTTKNKVNIYYFNEVTAGQSVNSTVSWDQFVETNKAKIEALKVETKDKVYEFINKCKNAEEDNILSKICLISSQVYQNTHQSYNFESLDLTLPFFQVRLDDKTEVGYVLDDTCDRTAKYITGNLKFDNQKSLFEDPCLAFTSHEIWLKEKAFATAGQQWCDGTSLVFRTVGQLFVGKSWDQIGGPIALLTQSSIIFKNNPFSIYVKMWGLISVNLAVMNLLPFPGLDGWHLLVCIIEGVSRKTLPIKFKKWSSTIGMILLLGLAAVIVVLDIVRCAA